MPRNSSPVRSQTTPQNESHLAESRNPIRLADAELFVNLDETPAERFNDNWRLRAGVGYRLAFSWRFEGSYILQLSRNTLQDPFDVSNNIVRFRLKYHWR